MMLGIAAPAIAADGPVEVVRETTDQLFSLIEENREQYEANPDALEEAVREILVPKLDQEYSGRLVLGRHSRGLEPEKVTEFAEALSDLLIERYAEQLLEFKNRDQLEIQPLSGEPDEGKTRVQTRVKLTTGQSVPVDYILRKTDCGWQVFDVVVEGVSYVVTFRTQFNEELNQNGFAEVLKRLKKGEIDVELDE
jgi:phospholipid transport system substrate-binding protein